MSNKRDEYLARNILQEIIRLNNLNNDIQKLFGKTDDDSVNKIMLSVDNLLTLFYELSDFTRMNGFDEDYILTSVLNCDDSKKSNKLYDGFLKLVSKGE